MRTMLLGALALLLIAPTATAQVDDARCAEPCGYIVPIIDLEFPEKQACGGSGLVFTGDGGNDCAPLPTADEPLVLQGTLTWYYDASEEPPYPKEVGQDIVVSFDGTRNNPSWLEMEVEPGEILIDDVALVDPQRFETEETDQGATVLWYRFRSDVTVTFTRTGDPSPQELERIEGRDGIVQVFLKAKSTESGSTYRESFGVEEFRFSALEGPGGVQSLQDEADQEAPGPALPLLGLAVLGAALRRRR